MGGDGVLETIEAPIYLWVKWSLKAEILLALKENQCDGS